MASGMPLEYGSVAHSRFSPRRRLGQHYMGSCSRFISTPLADPSWNSFSLSSLSFIASRDFHGAFAIAQP
jgi:hypothetical protein